MSILPERHVWDTQKKKNPLSPQKENLSSVSQRHVYKTQKYARDMTHSETWLTQRHDSLRDMTHSETETEKSYVRACLRRWLSGTCLRLMYCASQVPCLRDMTHTDFWGISGVWLIHVWIMSETYVYLYTDIHQIYISIYRHTIYIYI